MGTGLSGEPSETGHEFDVTRLTGTSFKQPKRTSARTTPDVDRRECGQCALGGREQGRRVREGADSARSGSSQLRHGEHGGPLNHSGGRARAGRCPLLYLKVQRRTSQYGEKASVPMVRVTGHHLGLSAAGLGAGQGECEGVAELR